MKLNEKKINEFFKIINEKKIKSVFQLKNRRDSIF